MTPLQGLAHFTGINQLVGASMTLGHGIAPSSAVLRIAPQADFATEVGTLSFEYGTTTIEFHDCKLDRTSLKRDDGGEVWELSILDRRWKWRFGQVSGRYNVRRDDATIQTGDAAGSEGMVVDTERTPRQLAAIYLDAMGESGYDVSELPDDARPAVDHDHDNPADALAELCDLLGCRIVLRLDGRVRIVPVGVGGDVPQEFLLEDSPAFNPPEKPDKIAVVCGPSSYQVDFPLEAVGLDTPDGDDASPGDTIRPIDQLSYMPAGGWSTADLPYFTNVGTSASGAYTSGLRSLAVKSVFRYYRIVTPVRIPGYAGSPDEQVTRREQILPIFEEQVRVALENGDRAPLAAAVFGVWYPGLDELANTQSELTPQGDGPSGEVPGQVLKTPFYTRGFTIDAARGLVIFDEPVYRNATPAAASVAVAPAQLVLRAKCQVRDGQSLAVDRHVRERATGGELDTPTRYLKHEELVLTHAPTYDPAGYASYPGGGGVDNRPVAAVATNVDEINEACDRYLDAALAEYELTLPRQVKAIGLRPLEMDGAIAQITYAVGSSGATTVVSRNSEAASFAVGHAERRRGDALRRAAEEAEKLRAPARERLMRRAAAAGRHAR
jgi:hypothetical protein